MSLDSDIRLLSRVRLFAGFEPDHLRLLAFGAEARALAQGTRLYRQDDASDGGFVVVRGNVDLISGLNDGVISSHGTGSLIGEMALISDTRHAATAIATENTEVLKITRPLFRRMLNEYLQLAVLLQQRIAESVSKSFRVVRFMYHGSCPLLLSVTGVLGSRRRARMPVTDWPVETVHAAFFAGL